MSSQSRIFDREEWRSGIRFLERQAKSEAAEEFRDILRLVDEVDAENGVASELVEWIDALEPVWNALETWRYGDGKEKLFDVYWRQYREEF